MNAKGPVQPTMPFVKLITHDPEELLSFYEDVFGFYVVTRVVEPNPGTDFGIEEIILHSSDDTGCSLVLLKFLERPNPAGGVILGMKVADVQATIEHALSAGASVEMPLQSMERHGVKVVFLADPHGNLIEVIEMIDAAG
ncbi:VOC family protein [Rhodococcus sp. P1Y]|uniref:VOC family protein n=1 Tax=Rhodococcus sp. P1Y TaxID=1302308 RepID=UPI000EB23618|nr:VOC family protein [Rhodococcus sp. P1Y]AYJ48277.1 VOC family protein [Rhodococcus sp. P1Y]